MQNAHQTHTHKYTRRVRNRPTLGMFIVNTVQPWELLQWDGVVDAAPQHDINLICFPGRELCSPHTFNAQANVLYNLVDATRLDGLIIWDGALGQHIAPEVMESFCRRYQSSFPVITAHIGIQGIPSVDLDNYTAMREAIVHLIEVHGHRRIAFIRGSEKFKGLQERYRAYAETMAEYGLPVDPQLVRFGSSEEMQEHEVAKWLLDDQASTVDAVVGHNDSVATIALRGLQSRGIRIPQEMSVVGFDDSMESKIVTPPLTTVLPPFYEMGQHAVKMMLAMLAGEDVPERVVLPGKLVIRESCGCASSLILGAAVEPVALKEHAREITLTDRRQDLLEKIHSVMDVSPEMPAWTISVVEGFLYDIYNGSPGRFLSALADVLRQVTEAGHAVTDWYKVISLLRREMLPHLQESEARCQAENLWHQARILIGETAKRTEMYVAWQKNQQTQILREIEATLMTTFEVAKLMDVLIEGLPRLGIPACYLSLYESPQTYMYPDPAPEMSRLILACQSNMHCVREEVGLQFPSPHLVPDSFLQEDKRYSLVLEALYFQHTQLGFILLEVGPRDGTVYDILRGQISSALQGALLVQRVQERSAELIRQNYILDTFMENVPDSIYFKDRESRILRSNQAHASMFEVNTPEDLVGKSDFDFFPTEQARPKYDQEQEILRTGEPLLRFEELDARGKWSLTTKMPLRNEHGDIIGTFGISRDITDLKQAQHELAVAYEEIRMMNDQLKEENMRMSAELDVSRRIQQMVLPSPLELQQIPNLDIVGYMKPADEVGGDYYDVLMTNGTIHIGIGDVTGHGLESGVLMLMTQTAIRTLVEHGETDQTSFLTTLNRVILKNAQRMQADKTLTLSLIHHVQGVLKVVGQHEDILIIRHGGHVERVDTIELGFPLGLEDDIDAFLAEATITLQVGESVVLYTDGITEAENANQEIYGLARLCTVASAYWAASAETIKQAIVDDITQFIGDHKVYDDVTLVVLQQR